MYQVNGMIKFALPRRPNQQVIEVDQSMIVDVKALANKLQLEKDTSGKKIPWSKFREMIVKGDTPHQATFRLSLASDEPFVVSTKKVGHPVNILTYQFQRAYQAAFPISQAKKKDLLALCASRAVPEEYHDFYEQLPVAEGVPDQPEDESDEPTQPAPRGRIPMNRRVIAKRHNGDRVPVAATDLEDPADEPDEPPKPAPRVRAPMKRRAPAKEPDDEQLLPVAQTAPGQPE